MLFCQFFINADQTFKNRGLARSRTACNNTHPVYKGVLYCGFLLDTPDGRIWLPGDSRLLECHLHMPAPDVILFDFSDNDWHIGLEGAVRLANAYPAARLVLIHWGTVDAPDMTPFNANPRDLYARIINPERICPLWPGEEFAL